ncbi:MAG: DUF3581 family protein [Thalassotalea sp.]
MFIENYYLESPQGIRFSRAQACQFAKQIADDFNPIHNVDAKRFCVPGDLLFSVVLAKAGLYEKMNFTFSGMVTEDIDLVFPTDIGDHFAIKDNNGKEYLDVQAAGNRSTNDQLVDSLTKAYVAFSGHTFPDILVDLMAKNGVMINPTRPMIMYQSMAIELDHFNATSIELKLSKSTLEHNGKRGQACLYFDLLSNGEVVGRGKKYMMLSGLRDYCATTMASVVTDYQVVKSSYQK